MGKGFKLRISRIFSSFKSCRDKDLPENPLPPVFRVPAADSPPPNLPKSSPPHPSSPLDCGCRRSKSHLSTSPHSSDFQWQKDNKWHVVARISSYRRRLPSDDSSDDAFPEILEDTTLKMKKKQRGTDPSENRGMRNKSKKKKKKRSRLRNSTSSADHGGGWFSTEDDNNGEQNDGDDDDTETLVSSKTFSELSTPDLSTNRGRKASSKGKAQRREPNNGELLSSPSPSPSVSSCASPARVSVFRQMVSWNSEGKVRESVAVVKTSRDPYKDFKRSMVEMIVEKEMYGTDDLEQLLQCFLYLNSQVHHRAIIDAFTEIWDAIFAKSPTPPSQQ